MKEDEPFRVRAYHKGILAHLYNPGLPVESAMRKLRNWIRKNEDLYNALYSGRREKRPLFHPSPGGADCGTFRGTVNGSPFL